MLKWRAKVRKGGKGAGLSIMGERWSDEVRGATRKRKDKQKKERGGERGRRTSAVVVRDFKISSPLRLSWRGGAPPQFHASSELNHTRTQPHSPRCERLCGAGHFLGGILGQKGGGGRATDGDDVVGWDGG